MGMFDEISIMAFKDYSDQNKTQYNLKAEMLIACMTAAHVRLKLFIVASNPAATIRRTCAAVMHAISIPAFRLC